MLTLLDRYIIYSEMLIKHENANEYYPNLINLGFCHSLVQVSDDNQLENQSRISINHLPELMSHRPSVYFSYWFSPYDQAVRVSILKKCIESVIEQMNYDLDNY